jgi:hypothetical protein
MAEWIEWLQQIPGLKPGHITWLAALSTVIVTGCFGGVLMLVRAWAWNKGRHEGRMEEREFRSKVDKGRHAVIERLVFVPQKDGTVLFDREAKEGIHTLKEVLRSDKLCELVEEELEEKKKDGIIFPPGELHSLMMGRVDLYIGGDEEAASMAAMFGREEEYNEDEPVYTVRNMVGDDGFEMVHILIVNPHYLKQARNAEFRERLRPRRQRYGRRYFHLLPQLAEDLIVSEQCFAEIEDEDKAGEQALFWKTLIRTQKASASTTV